MSRGPRRVAALRDWWERRRGRPSRVLDLLAGPDDDAGRGRSRAAPPRHASLSGAVALGEPRDDVPDD